MNTEELERFNEANKTVHPVTTQWHYPIMIAAGFETKTPSGVGFSRSYTYEHPSGRVIVVTTGVNADYWNDQTTGKFGYWSALEPHVKSM